MSVKITTLRLDEELATELKAVARAEGVPVSEAIRAALYQYIATCRADPGFQARFQNSWRKSAKPWSGWRAGGREAHKAVSGDRSLPQLMKGDEAGIDSSSKKAVHFRASAH